MKSSVTIILTVKKLNLDSPARGGGTSEGSAGSLSIGDERWRNTSYLTDEVTATIALP